MKIVGWGPHGNAVVASAVADEPEERDGGFTVRVQATTTPFATITFRLCTGVFM